MIDYNEGGVRGRSVVVLKEMDYNPFPHLFRKIEP